MEIKGIILIGSKDFLIKQFGKEKWEEVLSQLAGEDKELLGNDYILPTKNYNIKHYRALCNAIEKTFGQDCDEIFEGIGAYSANKVLLELYKPLFNTAKNNKRKMFVLITKAISRVSPEQWQTLDIEEKKWTIRCKSEIFKTYYDMIDPICKRNSGGVKELLKGIGYKNIKSTSNGIQLDEQKTPFVDLIFKWD